MKIFKEFTNEVVSLLQDGAVGIIPTDTLYGIVTSLYNEAGIKRIYKIKNRNLSKPVGTVLISDVSQIRELVSNKDLLMADQFWPGPVSVVLNLSLDFTYAHKGFNSLPFRIPANEKLRHLVQQTGPLATSSANFEGKEPTGTMQEALSTFRELVDFYVEGGDLTSNAASRIIRFDSNGETIIIRERS